MSPARTVFTAIALAALLACEPPLEPEVTEDASSPESALVEVKKCRIVFVDGTGRTTMGPEILVPSAVAVVLEMMGLVTECTVEPARRG